jgi:hypothetical protein
LAVLRRQIKQAPINLNFWAEDCYLTIASYMHDPVWFLPSFDMLPCKAIAKTFKWIIQNQIQTANLNSSATAKLASVVFSALGGEGSPNWLIDSSKDEKLSDSILKQILLLWGPTDTCKTTPAASALQMLLGKYSQELKEYEQKSED